MDSYTEMAPATEMATSPCGTYLRTRVLGAPRASSAGWRVAARPAQAPAPMAVDHGHRNNQIKFPPRMGPPTCSPPV